MKTTTGMTNVKDNGELLNTRDEKQRRITRMRIGMGINATIKKNMQKYHPKMGSAARITVQKTSETL